MTFLYLNLKILWKLLYASTFTHGSESFSGCGPNANLKSTNTHGTQQRESKENKHVEAASCYYWTEALCFCILKCRPGPVRNTTLTAECLFNRADVKKVQMALMDNIHFRDTLQFVFYSIYGLPLCACFSHLFSFKWLTLYIHPPSTRHVNFLNIIIIPNFSNASFVLFSSLLFLHTSFQHLLSRHGTPHQWIFTNTKYFNLTHPF